MLHFFYGHEEKLDMFYFSLIFCSNKVNKIYLTQQISNGFLPYIYFDKIFDIIVSFSSLKSILILNKLELALKI